MDNAIVKQEIKLSETIELGNILAKSGYFQDSKDAAQAIVKILAGRELGFGPVASMTGINVIKGKVSLSANLIAASIKRSGKYNYRVISLDNDGCSIAFFEGAEEVGQSTFTIKDAKAASLNGDNWRKFPKNMCFARAISNGAKWYCPDLSGGPVYTPDELGAEVDGETGEVIDVTPIAPAIDDTPTDLEAAKERIQKRMADKQPPPQSPDELMQLLNDTLGTEYTHPKHILNTVRKQSGMVDWNWPEPEDVDGWKFAYRQVRDYRDAKQAVEQAEQVAADLTNE